MPKLPTGVRKRPDGTLEKRISIDGVRYSIYGATVSVLREREAEKRKEIEEGRYTRNANLTLDKFFEEWTEIKRPIIKGNTLKLHSIYYRVHISPALGKNRIQKIERRQIQRFQLMLSQKLKPSTVNGIFRTLKDIFNEAVRQDIIVKSPAAGVKTLKEPEKATESYHRALTREEQALFLEAIRGDYYEEFLNLLLLAGMREGEAAALEWKDIDYKANVIHITKTVTFTENNRAVIGDSPKTEAGKRDIPMNEQIREVLKRQREKSLKIIPITGADSKRIFTSPHGKIIASHQANNAIDRALKRLEKAGTHIDHFTCHALRDTFATRYIEGGGNMQTLKTILGHSSISMTMDLYSHVLPDTKQEEMNRVKII